MPLGALLTSATARYEEAGYAELVVVLTCKSHDSANLTTHRHRPAICHLEIKTCFRHRHRHRPTRRHGGSVLICHITYHRPPFQQRPVVCCFYLWGALKKWPCPLPSDWGLSIWWVVDGNKRRLVADLGGYQLLSSCSQPRFPRPVAASPPTPAA